MARNAPDSSSRRQSSRVTKAPTQRAAPSRAQQQRDRRRFWIQVTAGLLVLAMLLPVIAVFL